MEDEWLDDYGWDVYDDYDDYARDWDEEDYWASYVDDTDDGPEYDPDPDPA